MTDSQHSPRPNSRIQILFRMALGPAVIAVASAFHPQPTGGLSGTLLRVQSDPLWLTIHLALLLAVAIFDASLLSWAKTVSSPWTALCKAGAAMNILFYSGFLAVDGVAASVIAGGNAQAARTVIPELFGSLLIDALGWLGGLGWLIASGAILLGRLKTGRGLVTPALLLLVGTAWLAVSHAAPIGVVGACLVTLAALLESKTALLVS